MSVKSVMQAPSFKPELEFEIIKLVLLREKYLQRLLTKLEKKSGKVDMTIIGIVDVLRDCSVEIVETIQTWERTQIAYPNIKPFTWNGQNYLTKMCEDLSFLLNFPDVQAWLGFSTHLNPFLVPPEILLEDADYSPHSFIVFGSKPPKIDPFQSQSQLLGAQSSSYHPTRQSKKKSYLSASLNPYMTPVVNDPRLVATQTKMNKAFKSIMNKKMKTKDSRKLFHDEKEDEEDNLDLAPSDFFECYLSYDMVVKIQKCWKILEKIHPDLHYQFLSSNTLASPSFMTATFPSIDQHGVELESSVLLKGEEVHHHTEALHQHPSTSEIPGLKLGSLPWSPMNSQSIHQTDSFIFNDTGSPSLTAPGRKSDLFQSSLDETALPIPVINETLRKSQLSQEVHSTFSTSQSLQDGGDQSFDPNKFHSSIKLSGSTYSWTPHEIALQKVVQKRGGELYIITAASTKGRMKAPYRKNRYLRLMSDLEHINQQITLLELNYEEYLSWLSSDHCPSLSSLTGKYLSNLLIFHNIHQPHINHLNIQSSPFSTSSPSSSTSSSSSSSLSSSSLRMIIPYVLKDIQVSLKPLYSQQLSLQYLLKIFQKISTGGNMKDINRLKELELLSDGEVLHTDEELSKQLEHHMAYKIQSFFIRILASSRRQQLYELQTISAKRIQTIYRLKRGKEQFIQTVKIIRYTNLIKKINEKLISCARYLGLKLETKRRFSIKLIQRVWRGYKIRCKIYQKKQFIHYISEIKKISDELTPALIEGLIDELSDYIFSYNYIIPVEIITILRGILYILNNTSPEIITVIEEDNNKDKKDSGSGGSGGGGDDYDIKELYGYNLHWYDCIKFLRRKSKLLRRLRSLAEYISLPNAYPPVFCNETIQHLAHITSTITESIFRYMKSKKILCLFYRYLVNIYHVYTLHHLFPEYYGVSTPLWYRELILLKYHVEEMKINYKISTRCYEYLLNMKENMIINGKKFGYINIAIINSYNEMNNNQKLSMTIHEKYVKYYENIIKNEEKYLNNLYLLKNILEIGLNVTKRDLSDYLLLNSPFNIKESELKQLYYKIDEKFILYNTILSKILTEEINQNINNKLRNFYHEEEEVEEVEMVVEEGKKNDEKKAIEWSTAEKTTGTKNQSQLDEYCNELGMILCNLMINKGKWEEFIDNIGGLQFLPDISGERLEYYHQLKEDIMKDLSSRRILIKQIQNELIQQMNKLKSYGYQIRLQLYEERREWDEPFLYIRQNEKEEDIQCAKRDIESSDRKLKQPNVYTLPDLENMTNNTGTATSTTSATNATSASGKGGGGATTTTTTTPPTPATTSGGATTSGDTNSTMKQIKRSQPILLLMDVKLPQKIRNILIEQLSHYHYTTCETLHDMNFHHLLPKIQLTFSNNNHCILLIDKGIDYVHRSEFNSSLQTAILSLYPLPKVLYIDGTYILNTINWYSPLSPYQSSMKIKTNITNYNTTPELLLGKIRYLIGLLEYGYRISIGQHLDPITMKPYPTPYTQLPSWLPSLFLYDYQYFIQFLQYSISYPDITYPTSSDTAHSTSSGGGSTSTSINMKEYDAKMPYTSQYISQSWSEHNNGHTPPYIVLAAVISAILGLWKAPLTEWRGSHYRLGLQSFLSISTSIPNLIEKLRLSPYPITTPLSWKQIEKVMKLTQIWDTLQTISFYSHPFIYILTNWVLTVSYFYEITYNLGGTVPIIDNTSTSNQQQQVRYQELINYTIVLDWDRDIISSQQCSNIIGNILHETLKDSIIYHNPRHPTTVLVHKLLENYNTLMTSMTIKKIEEYDVTIYYLSHTTSTSSSNTTSTSTGTDTSGTSSSSSSTTSSSNQQYLYIKIIIPIMDSQGKGIIFYNSYFYTLTIQQFLSSLQPNSTEIYESRIPKFNFSDPNNSLNWIELIANYLRIILPSYNKILLDTDYIILQHSRCQYLQLTLLGLINGYQCRLEIYEENYGELVMCIYGIHEIPSHPMYIRITNEIYKSILLKSDLEEERIYLENYDASVISSIFADRLIIYPSRRIEYSLQQRCGLSPPKLLSTITNSGQILGSSGFITKKIKFRTVRGPGRLIGQKILKLYNSLLIISIYEIHNNQEISPLRIQIYERLTSQCIEYKISSMERLLLFDYKNTQNLLQQIIQRLKYIRFDKNNIPIYPVLYIQHHDSFTLLYDRTTTGGSSSSAGGSGTKGSNRMESSVFYTIHTPSNYPPTTSSAGASTSTSTSTSNYMNGIIFDRTICHQQYGSNLLVGVCICHPSLSFLITVTDLLTCVQTNILLKYKELVTIFSQGYDIESFMDEINHLNDGDTVLDLLDEVIDAIDIGEYDGSRTAAAAAAKSTRARKNSDIDEGDEDEESNEDDQNNENDDDEEDSNEDQSKKKMKKIREKSKREEEEEEDEEEKSEGEITKESISLIPTDHYPIHYHGPCIRLNRDDEDEGSDEDENGGGRGMIVLACISEISSSLVQQQSQPQSPPQQQTILSKKHVYRSPHTVYVTSKLTDKQVKWSHYFPGSKERLKYLNKLNMNIIQPRQTLIHSFIPSKLIINPYLITTTTAKNMKATSSTNTAQIAGTGAVTSGTNNQIIHQYLIESSYIYEGKLKKNEHESARICWRSRMLPKQFVGGDRATAKMLLKRSARVVKLMKVEEMKVIEEPIYLQDEEGAIEDNVNYLPVIIYEILSEGYGKVDRHYRIHVMANNGEKLGEADIVDDNDLKLVLGIKMKHLLECDIEDRNMKEIFQYIINERIILNLFSMTKKVSTTGRREGIRLDPTHSNNKEGNGSVVILQRDSLSEFDSTEASTEDDDDNDGDNNQEDEDDDNENNEKNIQQLLLKYPSISQSTLWLRLYSTRHRMSGRSYRTVVIISSPNTLLSSHPNVYFQRYSIQSLLESNILTIIFNTNDLNGKKYTIRLYVQGSEIWKWLPRDVQEILKLTTKVKREKFGKWLIEQLRIQYSVMGDYELELYGMNKDATRNQKIIDYQNYTPTGKKKKTK